jgi:hypothetical protein
MTRRHCARCALQIRSVIASFLCESAAGAAASVAPRKPGKGRTKEKSKRRAAKRKGRKDEPTTTVAAAATDIGDECAPAPPSEAAVAQSEAGDSNHEYPEHGPYGLPMPSAALRLLQGAPPTTSSTSAAAAGGMRVSLKPSPLPPSVPRPELPRAKRSPPLRSLSPGSTPPAARQVSPPPRAAVASSPPPLSQPLPPAASSTRVSSTYTPMQQIDPIAAAAAHQQQQQQQQQAAPRSSAGWFSRSAPMSQGKQSAPWSTGVPPMPMSVATLLSHRPAWALPRRPASGHVGTPSPQPVPALMDDQRHQRELESRAQASREILDRTRDKPEMRELHELHERRLRELQAQRDVLEWTKSMPEVRERFEQVREERYRREDEEVMQKLRPQRTW